MKKVNILYWIFTVIFAGFMLMSGVTNAFVTPESVELITKQLGYPDYIIPFLGVAKILGAIALVVPGFPRIKEWAYAGLFFDLLGATYSAFMAQEFHPAMFSMLIFFAFEALSYIYYHKRLKLQQSGQLNLAGA
jgi:uncharacterized membrane protein YphA (DoxX/SURF4 family)